MVGIISVAVQMVIPEDPLHLGKATTGLLTSSVKRAYLYALHTSHTPSEKPSHTKSRSVHAQDTTAPSPTPSRVYQITCKNCNQHYIGSTTRFIHDRVKEHLKSDNSPVNKHISRCQNKYYKGIEVKIIVLENDLQTYPYSKRFT